MTIEIKVPPLPESVSEATVVTWHKQPGESVARDENLVDIETDKVVLEVPAPVDGVVGEHLKEEGDTVTAGEVLATVEPGAAKAAAPAAQAEEPEAEEPAAAPRGLEEMGPAVRRLVTENNLDPDQIKGTGRGGRITKEDVLKYLETKDSGKAAASVPQTPAPAAAPAAAPQAPAVAGEREERRVPMSRLRQRIAERLVGAQQTAAILTTFNEVNMQPIRSEEHTSELQSRSHLVCRLLLEK